MSDVLIIAGEMSGQEHAMSFLPSLKQLVPNANFYGVGGELFKEEGVELLYSLNDFSSMGFTEVIAKLPFYFRAMDHILAEVKKRKTKVAILIDFQSFNLKLAKKLKKMNVDVLYIVAPQAWAWKAYRAKTIQKAVHTLYAILPFEKKWFGDRGVTKIKNIPHPLITHYRNEIEDFKRSSFDEVSKRTRRVLLLPGSRNFEVKSLLPTFEDALKIFSEEFTDFEVAIVKSPSVKEENYNFQFKYSTYSSDELTSALKWADIAVASSGTVTLATGLFSLPTIVSYKLTPVNEFIASNFISYSGPVSLTNIIHDNKYVFPEYLLEEANKYNISYALKRILLNKEIYDNRVRILDKTKDLLSGDDFNFPEDLANVIGKA